LIVFLAEWMPIDPLTATLPAPPPATVAEMIS